AVHRADVSRRHEVAALLARVDREFPALRGVIHAAGALEDGVLMKQETRRGARPGRKGAKSREQRGTGATPEVPSPRPHPRYPRRRARSRLEVPLDLQGVPRQAAAGAADDPQILLRRHFPRDATRGVSAVHRGRVHPRRRSPHDRMRV
ncbi:MAG: KR domain-containing protein, partial [Planctomycetes bacterium]|nr:KR domain-containing protein [Planctomycetota bacterium]